MNPNNNESADFKLPIPDYAENQLSIKKEAVPDSAASIHDANNSMSQSIQSTKGVMQSSQTKSNVALPGVAPTTQNSNTTQYTGENDAIWEAQVKHVIAQTSRDPAQQLEQINKLKYEYVRHKFGIEMKEAKGQ